MFIYSRDNPELRTSDPAISDKKTKMETKKKYKAKCSCYHILDPKIYTHAIGSIVLPKRFACH